MNGSIYERELLNILSGDERSIERISRSRDPYYKYVLSSLIERPFYVTRAAGSLGADLVAIRDDYSMVIEVKSSERDKLIFSENSGTKQEQALRLHNKCLKSGLFITYAYRLKKASGDPWHFFTIKSDVEYKGNLSGLYNILPKQEVTKNGNFILQWSSGLPLLKLVSYLNNII
ncbi:PDDEXK family nuclease [Picrophilus oshimae]|uniref:Holliday junction resolvase (Hjc) n=1 Tax=Picrophilus torridus (strain ATCC 700027 / DSM 9790 / JCM 10055 / NBRC 100828 / KAW 2/3) TaxID=1122961 RepID=A0A8G2L7H3_PICTO|nr:hypothetical protein [Picrophilus oshimae]SMD30315.1 holliday junction resolvase (hjc) [Picrophilus oshimae DSM 9789]